MSKYINHLEQMYSPKTFGRKVDYFRYNFSDILTKVDSKVFSVLEIGPGMGESISYLNSLGVKNIDIIDSDSEILKALNKQFKIKRTILSKDINRLGKELGSYDLIIMIQVLEHIPLSQQVRVINALYSHLKKGGTISIVVPNANNPLGLVERYGDWQHNISYTNQSLKDLVDLANIKGYKLQISGFEIPPYDVLNIIRIFCQKILHMFLLLIMTINGGTFYRIMTPNIMLRIVRGK